jgi:hypothetical protein
MNRLGIVFILGIVLVGIARSQECDERTHVQSFLNACAIENSSQSELNLNLNQSAVFELDEASGHVISMFALLPTSKSDL